ncbi:unnamed protein product [Lasius platythorax]|uniref:Uncharacterized protein n=1 Tax=Lasius platythorax TaxID=488582 RepID=A0AAV2NL30_9HYME
MSAESKVPLYERDKDIRGADDGRSDVRGIYVTHETVKECNKRSFLPFYRIIYTLRNIKEADSSSKSGTKILTDRSRKVEKRCHLILDITQFGKKLQRI